MALKFKQRIPITVIGGFLGAGKTTLMNKLINSDGYKFGVIVNEFGETGVDGSLIESLDSDGVTELSNGCLCCFGRDDLVGSLIKLALRETPPEYVLIELSGVADPVPVAQTLLDPYVKSLFELDGIIGVADARNLLATLQDHREGTVQLAYASTIILNKCDLATPQELDLAKNIVRQLNPLVMMHEATHGDVSAGCVLGIQAFEPSWESDYTTQHTAGLSSVNLRAEHPVVRQQFNHFIETMILARPGDVLRAKGFISIEGFDTHVLLQSVRDVVNLSLAETANDGKTNLVVIGRDLEREDFEHCFELAVSKHPYKHVPLDIDEPEINLSGGKQHASKNL